MNVAKEAIVMEEKKKDDKRRGQTTVEYILLLAMIAGVFAVARQFIEPGVVQNVGTLVGMAQTEAWLGGKPAVDQTKPLNSYYVNGQMRVK